MLIEKIIKYLLFNMKDCSIRIPKREYINVENELFKVRMDGLRPNIYCNLELNACGYLNNLLLPEYRVKLYSDEDSYIISSNGVIPFRWLFILRDYYYKTSEIIITYNTSKEEKLRLYKLYELRLLRLGRLIDTYYYLSKRNSRYSFSVIEGPDNRDESILNNGVIECLKDSKKYSSTEYKGYKLSLNEEGGILIDNIFMREWLKFNDNNSKKSNLIGEYYYKTSENIQLEELLVLYKSLEDQGCLLSDMRRY